jgi:hypothetical protein
MKNSFFLIILFLLIHCKEKKQNINTNSRTGTITKVAEIKYGEKFFDYDQIDYYQIETRDDEIKELDENQNKSKVDKLRYGVILDETPENIKDLDFLNYMDKIGYSKKEINDSKFKEIDKIFIEKTVSEGETAACIPVFRDVLVFKKEGKIKGITKICFNCHQYRIIGTNANTENFGSNNDYYQLGSILDNTK